MTTATTRSYHVEIGIRRDDTATPQEGQEYIDHWTGSLQSDLAFVLLPSGDPTERAEAIAPALYRWFRDAWPRAQGTTYGRFPIFSVKVRLFADYGCRGEALAVVDGLTGAWQLGDDR